MATICIWVQQQQKPLQFLLLERELLKEFYLFQKSKRLGLSILSILPIKKENLGLVRNKFFKCQDTVLNFSG